jgi:hypothetical protein
VSGKESRCRVNATGLTPPYSHPWSDKEYADDYESAFQMVRQNRENGHCTRLIQLVEWVYSPDYTNTQYQRIRRFVFDCDYFKTQNTGNFVQVEPTLKIFSLPLESAVSDTPKHQTATELSEDGSNDKLTTDTTENYPRDRVQSFLKKTRQINSEEYADHRGEILRELEVYRDNISGTYSILENRTRDQYIAIPNTTRFTDPTDASKSQIRFEEALDSAHEDYSGGTMLSLTLDPKRYNDHAEATEAIREAKSRLLSYLDYQTGQYPTQITVPDWQSNGMLHYHVVLFGVSPVDESQNGTGSPTVSESQIREYWDNKQDVGCEVSLNRTWTRDDTWLLHRDDESTVSLSQYLGRRIRELVDLAQSGAGEVPLKHWKHALYWAYDLSYISCSDSLKEPSEDGSELPYAPAWRYIGTCRYEQIPTQIRDKMILVGSPA